MEALRLTRQQTLYLTRTTLRRPRPHHLQQTGHVQQPPHLLSSHPSSLSYLSSRFPRPRRLPSTRPPNRVLSNKPLNSSQPPPSYPPNPDPTSSLSLSQRLRKLSREYGWSAVGVYLALSALDFPFCFIAVRWLGTERIGRWEHQAVEWVRRAVPVQVPGKYRFWERGKEAEGEGNQEGGEGLEEVGYDHGVREAEVANMGDGASIWTQLALAYAIHKSFIFIRVPLTAAITPKVVRVLRGWGWDIGKRKSKAGVVGKGMGKE